MPMADHASHTHSHQSHSHNYTEANKAHFDATTAEKYDKQPLAIELARRQSDAMIKVYPFDESKTTVMDFACGTGLISRGLASHSHKIVGIDISEAMVEQYNQRVENQGIPSEEMRAICTELKGTAEELDGVKFDVIVCAAAYHHFESIEDVTRILAFFLKPGGSLMVSDIMKPLNGDDVFHGAHEHIVAHKGGFEEGDIQKAFDAANLHNMSFEKVSSAIKDGRTIDLFLAKGVKSL